MKVLVSGGTGFLGSHLVRFLQSKKVTTVFLGRNHKIGRSLEGGSARFISCALEDKSTFQNIPKDFTHVVHCAALSSSWGKRQDFERVNVIGTRNFLEVSKQFKLEKFVHISSPSIYVSPKDQLGIREVDPLPKRLINDYASSKKLAEDLVAQAYQIDALPVLTLRPQGIFGPGDRAIFPRIIQAAERGRLPRIGDGKALIDLTYVDNVVDAIWLSLNSPQSAEGQAFNITNGEPQPISELLRRVLGSLNLKYREVYLPFWLAYGWGTLAEWSSRRLNSSQHPSQKLAQKLAQEPALTRYTACIFGKSRVLDISRASRILGYRPQISIDEGVQRFASSWRRS